MRKVDEGGLSIGWNYNWNVRVTFKLPLEEKTTRGVPVTFYDRLEVITRGRSGERGLVITSPSSIKL